MQIKAKVSHMRKESELFALHGLKLDQYLSQRITPADYPSG